MHRFQTPAAITVTAELAAGELRVVATDRTDTVVTIRPADATESADVRAVDKLQVDFEAGELRLSTTRQWRDYTPFGGVGSVEVTVEVPTGSRIKAAAGLGRILGHGELGASEFDIAAGDIVVERISDTFAAKAATGDIRIGEVVRGEVRVETATGELEIGIAPGSAVRLETDAAAGSVRSELAPVDVPENGDIVTVHARNSLGNIVIRHAVAA
ncbi:hypothetical protein ACTD5D_24720 [Nocardia takedensis]|uniref:hypothetical protein n=1 Tax=Nocardia takedensis TaxID=259390 RepID=UPI0002EA6AB4|nr:hypothetical protein [Nocardia takedensis]